MRLRDALIVATADVRGGVDTLYTFDGGMVAFAPDVPGLKIIEPPSVDGPLFEGVAVAGSKPKST